jgi:AcrR family transcriptional regulator
MPRAGLDTEAVVSAAASLADRQGLPALTLARLAAELGVRAPSLYAHVDGLDDLRRRVAARGLAELADAMQVVAAGRAGQAALAAVAEAYRAYAAQHPGIYAAMQRAADVRDEPAAHRLVGVMVAVLRGYGMEGDDAIHGTRIIRSGLHGFVTLEAQDGFGLALELDDSFARLVSTLDRGLRVREPEAEHR